MNGIYKSLVAKSADIDDAALVLNSTVGEVCQLFEDSMLCYSQMGDMSYLGRRSCAFSSEIGKYCSIAWNVSIGPGNHDYRRISQHAMMYASRFGMIDDISQRYYNQYDGEVVIGNDVWIGCNAVIMRGVHVGNGAVIGANSVITKDVPPYAIVVAANKILKYRFESEIIDALQNLCWWDYSIDKVKDYIDLIADNPSLDLIEKLKRVLG